MSMMLLPWGSGFDQRQIKGRSTADKFAERKGDSNKEIEAKLTKNSGAAQ
jgi:hypothetical protein